MSEIISNTDQCHNACKPMLANRLFKFNLWDIERGQYFRDVLSLENDKITKWATLEKRTSNNVLWLQFTGLLDKNGNKIFEGDIVTYKRSVGNWTGQTMTTTHKIIFTEEVNAFVMDYESSYIKLRKHWGYEYEVIGNIFENPDLLQGLDSRP